MSAISNKKTNSTKANERHAFCAYCGSFIAPGMGKGVHTANRSASKFQYACSTCFDKSIGWHEDIELQKIVGGVNNGIKCGIELETNGSDAEFRLTMFRYGFHPTSDCSLNTDSTMYNHRSCEFVSDINKGFKRFTKQLVEIEKFLRDGKVGMDESCGTHFHVSMNDMELENGRNAMDFLRTSHNMEKVFKPMNELMENNPSKTAEFFGRYFTLYAKNTLLPWDRYNWVNLTNDNNIEFRLNKFVSANQYHAVCVFEIDCVKYLMKAINENQTTEHMGKILASKLEKAWAKYFA